MPAAYRTLCLAPVDRGSEFCPHFSPFPLHFPASPPFVANGKRGCCPPDLCTFKNAPNEMGNSKNARQNPKKNRPPWYVHAAGRRHSLKHVPFCVVCFFDAATSGPLSAPCHTRCGPNTHSHGYPVRGNVEGSTGVACIAQPSQEQRRNTTRFEKRYKLARRGGGAGKGCSGGPPVAQLWTQLPGPKFWCLLLELVLPTKVLYGHFLCTLFACFCAVRLFRLIFVVVSQHELFHSVIPLHPLAVYFISDIQLGFQGSPLGMRLFFSAMRTA